MRATMKALTALRCGKPVEAEVILRKLIEDEEHAKVRAAIEKFFLSGPLQWINHPEYVSYRWNRVNRHMVLAAANYRGEEHLMTVEI